MRFFGLLVKLFKAYFNYRRQMKKIQTKGGYRAAMDNMLEAYRRGDYAGAIQASMGMDPYFHGAMLMQLGRFDEAQQWLEQVTATQKETRLLALANSTLGQLCLQQQHYDEAQKRFQTALSLWPDRASTHRDLAELHLRRDNLSEGLHWAHLAVEKERAGEGVTPETQKTNLCEELATLAWAVAANSHDRSEVDRLAAEALDLAANNPVSSTAQIHFQVAQAYGLLGDTATSGRHFEEAARVDPNGLWGRAAQALAVRQ
jgi:tetratricopeptide (TPR) repeat protein